MNYCDLVKKYREYPLDGNNLFFSFCKLKQALANCTFDSKTVKKTLKNTAEEEITVFTQFLHQLIDFCQEWENSDASSKSDVAFISFYQNIQLTYDLIDEVLNATEGEEQEQEDQSDPKTLLDSYIKKVEELSERIDGFKSEATTTFAKNATVDNKLFSVLLNTISVLGIFVAIAFAGFGSMSLFSNLNLDLEDNFSKSIFILVLITFLIYNMILMLLYFIYKLNKLNSSNSDNNDKQFNISLKPFVTIDVVLLVMVIIMCVLIYCKMY